jgi:hypothetical protein
MHDIGEHPRFPLRDNGGEIKFLHRAGCRRGSREADEMDASCLVETRRAIAHPQTMRVSLRTRVSHAQPGSRDILGRGKCHERLIRRNLSSRDLCAGDFLAVQQQMKKKGRNRTKSLPALSFYGVVVSPSPLYFGIDDKLRGQRS